MARGEDFDVDDGEDAVVVVVRVRFELDALLADFVGGEDGVVVGYGWERGLADWRKVSWCWF